jgi:hypothetical protein
MEAGSTRKSADPKLAALDGSPKRYAVITCVSGCMLIAHPRAQLLRLGLGAHRYLGGQKRLLSRLLSLTESFDRFL